MADTRPCSYEPVEAVNEGFTCCCEGHADEMREEAIETLGDFDTYELGVEAG
jgi:hypothetical protein